MLIYGGALLLETKNGISSLTYNSQMELTTS
jgi:hypothetical protein